MIDSYSINSPQTTSIAQPEKNNLHATTLSVISHSMANAETLVREILNTLQESNNQTSKNNALLNMARTLSTDFKDGAPGAGNANQSEKFKEFVKTAADLGFDFSDISNESQMANAIENIKTRTDTLAGNQKTEVLKLQQYTDMLRELTNLQSTLMKAMHDSNSSIISKMS